jgi:hypothetical protein
MPPVFEIISVDGELKLRALSSRDADRLFELTDANREYLPKYLP